MCVTWSKERNVKKGSDIKDRNKLKQFVLAGKRCTGLEAEGKLERGQYGVCGNGDRHVCFGMIKRISETSCKSLHVILKW